MCACTGRRRRLRRHVSTAHLVASPGAVDHGVRDEHGASAASGCEPQRAAWKRRTELAPRTARGSRAACARALRHARRTTPLRRVGSWSGRGGCADTSRCCRVASSERAPCRLRPRFGHAGHRARVHDRRSGRRAGGTRYGGPSARQLPNCQRATCARAVLCPPSCCVAHLSNALPGLLVCRTTQAGSARRALRPARCPRAKWLCSTRRTTWRRT